MSNVICKVPRKKKTNTWHRTSGWSFPNTSKTRSCWGMHWTAPKRFRSHFWESWFALTLNQPKHPKLFPPHSWEALAAQTLPHVLFCSDVFSWKSRDSCQIWVTIPLSPVNKNGKYLPSRLAHDSHVLLLGGSSRLVSRLFHPSYKWINPTKSHL